MLIPLILILGGSWYFVFRHPDRRKRLYSFALDFPNLFSKKVNSLLSKDNRTALAIAIGAIAIVLAIVFSNNQPQNAGNQNDREYQFKLKKYETCVMTWTGYEGMADMMCRKEAGLN